MQGREPGNTMITGGAGDQHFPAVHLRPPRNWINDPNGLVHHDGYYHVFFQYNPNGTEHTDMHWGHFRSTDLLRWELLPVALAPTPGGEDDGGVWSGNAVEVGDEVRAFYSARRTDRWYQPVTSAVSHDGGVTFAKRGELHTPDAPEGTVMFRDPYVWRDGRQWRMLVGAGMADGRGAALHYASNDADEWTYDGIFFARAPEQLPRGRTTEQAWECVQYLHFADGRGAVLACAWNPDADGQCVVAWAGRERGGSFDAGAPQLFDYGPDFYAPAVLPAPDGRWLLWGWSWEARDAERVDAPSTWAEEAGWAGVLTVPREVTVADDGTVRQQPARELAQLRRAQRVRAEGDTHVDEPSILGEIDQSCEVSARLAPGGGLRLVTSADGREYLEITRDASTGEVVIDRTHASLDPRARGGTWRLPPGAGETELCLIVDHSIAEVFTPEGHALTLRFYPIGDGPWRLMATGAADRVPYAVGAWDLAPLDILDKSEERS